MDDQSADCLLAEVEKVRGDLSDLVETLKGMLDDPLQDNGGWKDSLRWLIAQFDGSDVSTDVGGGSFSDAKEVADASE